MNESFECECFGIVLFITGFDSWKVIEAKRKKITEDCPNCDTCLTPAASTKSIIWLYAFGDADRKMNRELLDYFSIDQIKALLLSTQLLTIIILFCFLTGVISCLSKASRNLFLFDEVNEYTFVLIQRQD
jgi:hypothetical protein